MKKFLLIPILVFSGLSHAQESEQVRTETESALEERLKQEQESLLKSFVIIPHRPNYFMPVTYNHHVNTDPYTPLSATDPDTANIDYIEVKFQLSFKIPVWMEVFNKNTDLWFAYTQVAYWQLYNGDASSPFRETNYEPELYLDIKTDHKIFNFTNSHILVGINHQSNGRSKPLSRSWNRVMAGFVFEKGNIVLSINPWWRIPTNEKDDDNPDIEKYLGYADIGVIYKRNKRVYSLKLNNNMRSDDNRTSIELNWSVPIKGRFKGIIQYINGYGDGLIDYQNRNQRIGFGIMLTDWL